MAVVIGTKKLSKPRTVSPGGIVYLVKHAIIHEHYDEATFANDIALVRLEAPIEFSDTVKKIELATKQVPPNAELQVYGFGRFTVVIFRIDKIYKENILQTSTNAD